MNTDVPSDVAAVRAAWQAARAGTPAVVRFSGDPRRALEPLSDHLLPSWPIRDLPEGESRILWFSEGPAAEAAADICIPAALLLGVPWLIVVSGPRAGDRGLQYGLEVEGGGGGLVQPTHVTGLSIPDSPQELEAAIIEHTEQGHLVVAAALVNELAGRAPEKAAPHRWVHVARSFYLTRSDGIVAARQHMHASPGRSMVLNFAGQATENPRIALHLFRRAMREAQTDEERADAAYYRNRREVTLGQRSSRDTGEPHHKFLLAMARFGTASRAAYRRKEPGPEHEALEAVGTDAAMAVSHWVHARYAEGGGRRLATVKMLLTLGMVRTAGWVAVEYLQFPDADPSMAAGLPYLRVPRMLLALEIAKLATRFDVKRALALAPLLGQTDHNPAIRSFGMILVAAARAIVDDDPRALGMLDRSELQDQMQQSFCEILVGATPFASPAIEARLLALAADWSAEIANLADVRETWLARLRELQLDHIPLGAYTLTEPLSQGAMGGVWRGEHTRLRHPVAVKFVLRAAIKHAKAFQEEVEVLATLDHPAVVQVLDVGEVTQATEALSGGTLVAGTPYLVMEYVSGGTLTSFRGTLSWTEVRALLLALLDALAYIHAQGILHRDLKPQNILVDYTDQGATVRLSDFGLAVENMRNKVAGTPTYMAPEQFTGIGMGPWSDLYAVGCVCTALLTGLPPFIGSPKRLARAHRDRPVPPLESPIPVPAGFEGWRQRLLEKAPEDRFPNARAASLALRALGSAPPPQKLIAQPPVQHTHASFDFATMVGLPEESVPSLGSSQTSFRTLLPSHGFAPRPARPRLPTDRLFGRFPSPCLGQGDARHALWSTAVEAYESETIAEITVGVPLGMSLERVLAWAQRRLREFGIQTQSDDTGDFTLATQRPAFAPGVHVKTGSSEEPVRLARLDTMEATAQIRTQVACSHDLTWDLVCRAHGFPDLLDALLAEVIRHPGLVASEGGLVPAAPLPARLSAETRFWQGLFEGLDSPNQAVLLKAAASPPGAEEERLPDLFEGPPGQERLLSGLRRHLETWMEETGDAESVHRALLATATSAFRQGWHLLGLGEPEAAEPLLRMALAEPDAPRALNAALDLMLVEPTDERRVAAASIVVPTPPTIEDTGALSKARRMLENLAFLGRQDGRGETEALVLALTAGSDWVSWAPVFDTSPAAWSEKLLHHGLTLAQDAERPERVSRIRRLLESGLHSVGGHDGHESG